MSMRSISPEREAAAQAKFREEIKPPQHEAVNMGLAQGLDQHEFLEFGGYYYDVPPVPYTLGLRLHELHLTLDRIRDIEKISPAEALPDLHILYDEVLGLFKRLCRPVVHPLLPNTWVRRLTWRWRRNPFAIASEREMAELFGFFSACRMKSRVRLGQNSIFRPSQSRQTRLTILPTSSDSTRHG